MADVYVKCENMKPSGSLKDRKMGPWRRIATVLPDNRDRYLSEKKYTT